MTHRSKNLVLDGLILYALPQSPYCARLRVVLSLKGIPYEEREPAGGSYQTTEYQSLVPAGSVPAIQTGDWILHDSRAIMELLDEFRPTPALWDPDPVLRARQRGLVDYHDTKLEPTIRELVALARQPASSDRDHSVDLIRDRLFDRFYRLRRLVQPDPWLGGKQPCAADWSYPFSLAVGFELMKAVGRDLDLPETLLRWYQKVQKEPLVANEIERIRNAMTLWLKLGYGVAQTSGFQADLQPGSDKLPPIQ